MEALAAAAAAVLPPTSSGSAGAVAADVEAAPSKSAGGEGAAGSVEFQVFVGHRRRLPPDDVLFESGNIEREQLARQVAVEVVRDERRQLSREAQLSGEPHLAGQLSAAFECAQCHAALPTARLLELHVAELHDSFFAAQAARRMPVYLCLVEGCHRKFCTVEERKQHLVDHHRFPRNLHFDRIHLRRRKAQIRPLPRFQKGGHRRQPMAGDAAAPTTPSAGAAGPPPASDEAAAAGPAAAKEGAMAAAAPAGGDDVVAGMSRLSMAAENSSVPAVVHFGHRRNRGGVPGLARGRGSGGGGGGGSGPPCSGGT